MLLYLIKQLKKRKIVWILEQKQDKSQEGEKEVKYKLRSTSTPPESLAKTKKKTL